MNKQEAFEKWYEDWVNEPDLKFYYQRGWIAAWDIQQAKIDVLVEALEQIVKIHCEDNAHAFQIAKQALKQAE